MYPLSLRFPLHLLPYRLIDDNWPIRVGKLDICNGFSISLRRWGWNYLWARSTVASFIGICIRLLRIHSVAWCWLSRVWSFLYWLRLLLLLLLSWLLKFCNLCLSLWSSLGSLLSFYLLLLIFLLLLCNMPIRLESSLRAPDIYRWYFLRTRMSSCRAGVGHDIRLLPLKNFWRTFLIGAIVFFHSVSGGLPRHVVKLRYFEPAASLLKFLL